MEIILFVLAGCVLGIVTGLIPGIHVNTIALLVLQIATQGNFNLVLNVGDALIVNCTGTSHHPNNMIALLQQQFSQVRAILPGDTSNQSGGQKILLWIQEIFTTLNTIITNTAQNALQLHVDSSGIIRSI